MSDDLTPSQQAAAFHGLAINRSTPPSERLECALTALNLYETVTEKLRAERDALIPVVEAAIAFVDGSASLGPVVAATRAWRAKRTEGAQP